MFETWQVSLLTANGQLFGPPLAWHQPDARAVAEQYARDFNAGVKAAPRVSAAIGVIHVVAHAHPYGTKPVKDSSGNFLDT